jgi:hypothetical protein
MWEGGGGKMRRAAQREETAMVGSWLFCKQHLPCLIGLDTWRYYGGLDEEHSILRVEIQFGMPKGAKMNLALNQLK